ncbi:glycosyltransferase, partial [bacterium]|nr:glycosyltransferase [bacterium]
MRFDEIGIDLDWSTQAVDTKGDALAMVIEARRSARMIGPGSQVVVPEERNELTRTLVLGLPIRYRTHDQEDRKKSQKSTHPNLKNRITSQKSAWNESMRTLLEFLRSVKASTNKIDSAQISRCVSNVWYFWEMVSVVIPVYNKVELTNRCLDSLISNSRALSEVFVVDNASTDSTPETLLQWRVRFQELNIPLRILKNEKNEGFGRACNQGIRLATGDFVAI